MRYTESSIHGYLSIHALENHTDYDIVDETGLGGTSANFQALTNEEIDNYWIYTGTAWSSFLENEYTGQDPDELYQQAKEQLRDEYDLELLNRSPFNNTYVFFGTEEFLNTNGIETLSDLASTINDGNTDLTIAMTTEFYERDDGWPGVTEAYGFADQAEDVNTRTVSPGLIYQSVNEDQADLGVGFSTNAKLKQFGFVMIEDDENFFPVYNACPIVRTETLESQPEIESALNPIPPELTTDVMRSLNAEVDIEEKEPRTVAENWLQEEDLI